MVKAPRCACGCGLPVAQEGSFYPGHAAKVGHHWAKNAALRKQTTLTLLERRRALVKRLFASRLTTHDFSEEYFALYDVVKLLRFDAELEVLVEAPDTWYAIDVGIPALKLGWEYDPGHRYGQQAVEQTARNRVLVAAGWVIHHVKTIPTEREVAKIVSKHEALLG